MTKINCLNIFTDGGARGNPGPAAVGILIKNQSGERITAFGQFIGWATNNVAEYQAVIVALEWLLGHQEIIKNYQQINFHLDSTLVVNQLNGKFKVKNLKLKNLIIKIKVLEKKIYQKTSYRFIPRAKNYQADSLVNQTLDQKNF
jgi:ribonuclease HI